jgi:hypothetical protein
MHTSHSFRHKLRTSRCNCHAPAAGCKDRSRRRSIHRLPSWTGEGDKWSDLTGNGDGIDQDCDGNGESEA